MYQDGSFAEGYAIGRDSNNSNSDWGGNGAWWIIILIALFGWGGFGNGFGGANGGGRINYELGKMATTNDVASGFNNSAVLSSLNDLKLGQAGLQQTMCQGFNGVNTSILTTGNSIQSELASCCCQTQRAIDGVSYNMAKNTCDIITASNANTQRIIDMFTSDKIDSLNRELTLAQGQLSQNAQTNAIVSALAPKAPVPAYPVFPATPFAFSGGVPFGFNNGCGCGSNTSIQ